MQPPDWNGKYGSCLQPNILRRYHGKNEFRLKYPLATIHLLIGIVGQVRTIRIPQSAIAPLFFVDGIFNVLYSYLENVLNSLNYLGIQNQDSPLRDISMHEHYTVYSQIVAMDEFFRLRDPLNVTGERGDTLLYTWPGDFFNRPAIIRSIGELATLNYSYPEAIRPKPAIVNDSPVDIVYSVKERSSDTSMLRSATAGLSAQREPWASPSTTSTSWSR
ncbi:MAG: hypothetical protein QHI48_04445 [Bacteroidota bacterium]|nr:hypothetical protein [Bacteroidota bacterium]